MDSEDRWQLVWLGWGLYFSAAEYVALRSQDPHAPLSHHVRRALGVRKQPAHQRAGQVALGAALVWFISHIYQEIKDD